MVPMASRFAEWMTRAATPRAGLGNLLVGGRTINAQQAGRGPSVATMNVNWQSPGQPQILDQDAQAFGQDAYLNQVYVMRCVQAIANTIAGLDFKAGIDPSDPSTHDATAPLAQLLGPATPQAPGGPNPETSSRAFWAWTICQYIVYGRFGWECQLVPRKQQIVALWPLVSACLAAIPSQGGDRFFDGFVYTTPMAGDITMKPEQLVYCHRPSLTDWRVPETVMSAAKLPIYIAKGLDRYMVKLLENDMVASTLVVTPPFDEGSARRAWQEQFLTSFTGIDNRGKTIFAEAEYDENDSSSRPLVQVEKIAQTAIEASLIEITKEAKIDITIALGVPISLIGNASERIYANAEMEYKNFWVMTIINLIAELQDHINNKLAPRVGDEVGWFDLSRVAALQPPSIFAPPMIGDVINFGIASPAQIANVLGIPAADSVQDSDTETVEIGEEGSHVGSGNSNRSFPSWKGTHVTKGQMLDAYMRYEQRPKNTYNMDEKFIASKWLRQDHVHLRGNNVPVEVIPPVEPIARRAELPNGAAEIVATAGGALRRHEEAALEKRARESREIAQRTREIGEGTRAVVMADRLAGNVHAKLAKHYPEKVLKWVDDADWTGPTQVNLADIDMDKRPGGRDPKKVKGIISAMGKGHTGALAPVVLVKTPENDKYKVADGYHRTKAHEQMGHEAVNAYVAEVGDEEGPWDKDMHDAKLNRMAELVEQHRSVSQDNSAYHLGISDHLAKRPMQSEEEFDAKHPMHDADDYPLYEAGFNADREDLSLVLAPAPKKDKAKIESSSRSVGDAAGDLEHCAWCGEPATIMKQAPHGPLPLCNEHASEGKHPDAIVQRSWVENKHPIVPGEFGHIDVDPEEVKTFLKEGKPEVPEIAPYSGTDFHHWVKDNEAGLLELAEAEDEEHKGAA